MLADGWILIDGFKPKEISQSVISQPSSLKKMPGVYAFFLDGLLRYVGASSSIRTRVHNHVIWRSPAGWIRTPWGPCGRVNLQVLYTTDLEEALRVEGRIIRDFYPPGNKRIERKI